MFIDDWLILHLHVFPTNKMTIRVGNKMKTRALPNNLMNLKGAIQIKVGKAHNSIILTIVVIIGGWTWMHEVKRFQLS